MKKMLCLILLLFVFTAAKAKPQAAMPAQKATDSYADEDQWAAPAPAAPVAAPAVKPAAAPAFPANMPDPATIATVSALMANPDFVRFISEGTPAEQKARLDAISTLASIAPMMQAQRAADKR